MKYKLPRAILFILILVTLFGCSDSTQKQVRQTVKAYNDTLMQVYTTGNIDLLNTVATEQEARRVQLFLSYLNDEHKVMQAKLKQFDFVDTLQRTSKTKDGKKTSVYYQVYTNELWEYTYLDSRNSAVLEGPTTLKYKATYDVVQLTGQQDWLVYKIKFEEEK